MEIIPTDDIVLVDLGSMDEDDEEDDEEDDDVFVLAVYPRRWRNLDAVRRRLF